MPVWIQIISAVVQLVRLIMDLLKDNPKAAKQCSVAIKEARSSGDVGKLQELLEKLKNGDDQC